MGHVNVRGHEWALVGGHLVVDWLNTRSWRGDPHRDIDRILDVTAFDGWRDAVRDTHGLEVPRVKDVDELLSIRQLRDAMLEWLDVVVGNGTAATPPCTLQAAIVAATTRATLHPRLPLAWRVQSDSPRPALDTLALATSEFLSSDRPQLRQCALQSCGWYFLDDTRNHSRRWCTPNECGNTARVRRYTARRRGNPSA